MVVRLLCAVLGALALVGCSTVATPPGSRLTGSAPENLATADVATGLAVPWSIGILPDGSALVTLRDAAEVVRVLPDGTTRSLGVVPGVERSSDEGGLLGLAVSPDFADRPVVYIYYTTESDNRVAEVSVEGNRLGRPRVVLAGIPHAPRHDGGRMVFGPDGALYVGTGDAAQPDLAQDLGSLAGKILRITVSGEAAPGNPFPGSPIFSLGHRNVEGLAFDEQGRLWASEFGQDEWDELNLVTAGGNYGWPLVEGVGEQEGLIDPMVVWRPADASPSGLALGADGALYLAALRGESLWRIPLDDGGVGVPTRLLAGAFGRLRDVVRSPDGGLWVLTNNTARGDPRPGDDRLVAVPYGS